MLFRVLVMALVGCAATVDAKAAEPLVAEVTFRRITADGALRGCAFEFHTIFIDHIGSGGKPVALTGSINLMLGQGRTPVGFFKVIGTDIEQLSPDKVRRFKVNFAMPTKDGTPIKALGSVPCDVDEGRCSFFAGIEWLGLIEELSRTQKISIVFNRGAKRLDSGVSLSVDPGLLMQAATCAREVGTLLR